MAKFAVVAQALPNPGTVGADAVLWAVIEHALAVGHQIDPCVVILDEAQVAGPGREAVERHVRALEGRGIPVVQVSQPSSDSGVRDPAETGLGRMLRRVRRGWGLATADLDVLYPVMSLVPRLNDALTAASPDAVLVFDTGAAVALRDWQGAPRFVIPGDPPHLAERYRAAPVQRGENRVSNAMHRAVEVMRQRRLPGQILRLVRDYEAVGFFGAQHANWVESEGIRCAYVRPTVIDRAGQEWRQLRLSHAARTKPKIVVLGHLNGTASRSGFQPLVRETIPTLERLLGQDGFELHLIGRGTFSDEDMVGLRRPSVVIRGYVEDASAEFLSADVFLSPTPYPVGVRVRIIEALSYGCCIVTHPASAAGLPELVDRHNVRLAEAGNGWGNAIAEALSDTQLRESLQEAARRTYEKCFSPTAAAGPLIEELERLAHGVRRNG